MEEDMIFDPEIFGENTNEEMMNWEPTIADAPTFTPIEGTGLSEVTDIFGGTHICDPMEVDIMSGLPAGSLGGSQPSGVGDYNPSFTGSGADSLEQMKLDQSYELESQRDAAVDNYNDAKARGDIDEMVKWEAKANDLQGDIYTLWDTTTYGLPPKAPGIY